MQRRFFQAAILAVATTCFVPAHAQGSPSGNIELRNVAEVETEVKTPDGKVEKKRVAAQKAAPGTEVIYTSIFRNISAKPAGNLAVVNPIPANTTYVGGSVFGDNTEITFSADGGKTWAPLDKLKVHGADGKDRPAGVTEITHIRWVYRGELPPARQGSVGFRVNVN